MSEERKSMADKKLEREVKKIAKNVKWSEDINKPIMDKESMNKLLDIGAYPVPFIRFTVGSADLKKTKRMDTAKLIKHNYVSYGDCFNGAFPEKIIIYVLCQFANRHPYPNLLFNRILSAIKTIKKVGKV